MVIISRAVGTPENDGATIQYKEQKSNKLLIKIFFFFFSFVNIIIKLIS